MTSNTLIQNGGGGGGAPLIHTHALSDLLGLYTEITASEMASRVLPTRFEKGLLVDLIGGGVFHADPLGNAWSGRLSSLPGLVLTSSAGATEITRKRTLNTLGSNARRRVHAADGRPLGTLFEGAHAYQNPRPQPLASQCSILGGVSDAAPPSGWSGNWLSFGDNSARRFAAQAHPFVSGQSYWLSVFVRMADGLAPSFSGAQTSWDFEPLIASNVAVLNPDTGLAGVKVEGPFAGGVYLVSGYGVATSTATGSAGIDKKTSATARQFITGPISYGPGRYPQSIFLHPNPTPTSRAADVLALPLTAFDVGGGISVFGQFTWSRPMDIGSRLLSLGSANNRLEVYQSGAAIFCAHFDGATQRFVQLASDAQLTLGTSYSFAVAIDTVTGRLRGKMTGITAPTELTTIPTTLSGNMPVLGVGSYLGTGTSAANLPISMAGVVDRPLTAAEIATITG